MIIRVGTTATLTAIEQKLARHVARCRYEAARKSGIPDRRMGTQSVIDTDVEGFASELAFAKLIGAYPNLDVGQRPTFDLKTAGGLTIDVKSSKYKTARLLATRWKVDKPIPHYFVLMVGTCPNYRFVGCLEGVELLRPERLRDLGRGPGYVAEQIELRDFSF